MKKNIAIVLAFLAFALVGCEDKTPFEPGPAATTKQFIYAPLPAELGQELDPEAGVTSHDFVLERKDTKDAQTVKLVVIENTDNVFDVPASVTFAAGEAQATVTFKFNKMEVGGTYKLTVQVDLASIDPYNLDVNAAGTPNVPVYEYEATLIKYEDGVGVFVDDAVIASTFSVDPSMAWLVKYQIAELPSGNFKVRVLGPYCSAASAVDDNGVFDACPFNDPGDWDDSKPYNINLLIDPVAGEAVMDDAELGVDYGYGMLGLYNYKTIATAEFDAEAESVTFLAENQTLVFAMGSDLYNYAGYRFYLSEEAYVADNVAAAKPAQLPAKNRNLK